MQKESMYNKHMLNTLRNRLNKLNTKKNTLNIYKQHTMMHKENKGHSKCTNHTIITLYYYALQLNFLTPTENQIKV